MNQLRGKGAYDQDLWPELDLWDAGVEGETTPGRCPLITWATVAHAVPQCTQNKYKKMGWKRRFSIQRYYQDRMRNRAGKSKFEIPDVFSQSFRVSWWPYGSQVSILGWLPVGCSDILFYWDVQCTGRVELLWNCQFYICPFLFVSLIINLSSFPWARFLFSSFP